MATSNRGVDGAANMVFTHCRFAITFALLQRSLVLVESNLIRVARLVHGGDVKTFRCAGESVNHSACLLLVVVAVTVGGCNSPSQSGSSVYKAPIVTLADLEKATQDHWFFGYLGSDDNHHFFRVDEIGYVHVEKSIPLPEFLTLYDDEDEGVSTGRELFVTIKDGKLTHPEPRPMSDCFNAP